MPCVSHHAAVLSGLPCCRGMPRPSVQTCNGAVACQLMDCLHPGSINMRKVDFNLRNDYEFIANYKEVQKAFDSQGIDRVRTKHLCCLWVLSRAGVVEVGLSGTGQAGVGCCPLVVGVAWGRCPSIGRQLLPARECA